jgi:hypothetical protein
VVEEEDLDFLGAFGEEVDLDFGVAPGGAFEHGAGEIGAEGFEFAHDLGGGEAHELLAFEVFLVLENPT